jgi:hypothetical protein
MNKTNLDQALAALGDALKSQEPDSFLTNPKEFVKKIPLRSLSGDHINGGKIQSFASAGITDQSSKQQILVKDDGVHITSLSVNRIKELTVDGTVTANIIKTDILEVNEIKADIKFEKDTPIVFSGDNLEGKGLLWSGRGNTKQFIYASNPDRLFSSENLDFARGKSITVNNIKLIDENELGPTIIKSNLREVGRLNGLIVDGSVSIGQYLIFNNETNRLGLGTEDPNGAFSIAEDGIEVVIGAKDFNKGYIGTYASHPFQLVTDNTARISISSGGNITLGNPSTGQIQVSIIGSLGVNVITTDPRANLHVNGPIKFNDKLHLSSIEAPQSGAFNEGDITWNSNPQPGRFIGWVCTRAGNPGLWSGFGRIE